MRLTNISTCLFAAIADVHQLMISDGDATIYKDGHLDVTIPFLHFLCKRGYVDTSNLPKAEQSRLSFCRKTGPNLRLGASSNAEVQTPISKIA